MARTAELMQAKESLAGVVGGKLVDIRAGDIAEADSEVVTLWPTIWVPLVPRFTTGPAPVIEQATAAPGEKRGRR